MDWLLESTEELFPEAFGWKVPFRRLSLLVGNTCLSILTINQFMSVNSFDAKTAIQNLLDEMGVGKALCYGATIMLPLFCH